MADYVEKLWVDLVDQFRDKPNIEALVEVIAHQLQDVFTFYEQLQIERGVYTAQGKQLDGIGDIVSLTRGEAGLLSGDPIPYDVLNDTLYRQFLIFKILKNTSHTTYPDIIKAFQMFWDRPLYYREDPEQPATMIFDTGEMKGLVDTSPLFITPLIRAAGVTLKIYATTRTEMDAAVVAIAPGLGYGYTETELPELERDIDYGATLHIGAGVATVSIDTLPALEREIDYTGYVRPGSVVHSLSETPIGDVEYRSDSHFEDKEEDGT